MIATQIAVLFAAYRKADYADPDGFTTQLAVVLSKYPDEVIEKVTSPLTGIQRRLKFAPSIAEVVEACEEAMKPIRRRWEREELERERARALPPPNRPLTPEEQARRVEQVRAWRRPGYPGRRIAACRKSC